MDWLLLSQLHCFFAYSEQALAVLDNLVQAAVKMAVEMAVVVPGVEDFWPHLSQTSCSSCFYSCLPRWKTSMFEKEISVNLAGAVYLQVDFAWVDSWASLGEAETFSAEA